MRNLSYHLRDLQYTWMTSGLAYRRTLDPAPATMPTHSIPALSSSGHLECTQFHRVIISVRISYCLAISISFRPPNFFFPLPSTASGFEWEMTSTKPCSYHTLTITMAVDQSIVPGAITSSMRSVPDWFVRSLTPSLVSTLQLFFTSLRYTCHICPPTQALMEYTPNACCVSPSPIRLPLLLCSGYIGRFVFFLPDSLTLSSHFPI